jgi:predicted DNA-binding transcriptional regulator AlpA
LDPAAFIIEKDQEMLQRILREKELHAYDGLGKTVRGNMIERGEYPRPVKLNDRGGRAKAWLESEIIAWQRWRQARRDGTAKPDGLWRDYLEAERKP